MVFGTDHPFSKTLSLALAERRFTSSSRAVGAIALRVITLPLDFLPHTHTGNSGGHVHGFSLL
jgi:hypothetical protein